VNVYADCVGFYRNTPGCILDFALLEFPIFLWIFGKDFGSIGSIDKEIKTGGC